MMRAIGDQVAKNPEYLSILDKKAINNGKIDDKTQVEKVSVMNKLLNDALRAKGYAGPDIKMVLTDVTALNEPYYTNTFVVGGSLGIINGELIYDSETSELSAFRLGITATAISLIKN